MSNRDYRKVVLYGDNQSKKYKDNKMPLECNKKNSYVFSKLNDKLSLKDQIKNSLINEIDNDLDYILSEIEYIYVDCDDFLGYVNSHPEIRKYIVVYPRIIDSGDVNTINNIYDEYKGIFPELYIHITGNVSPEPMLKVKNTVERLKEEADELKKRNYSPAEYLMYVFDKLRAYKYSEDIVYKPDSCRSLSDVIEDKNMVCLGYCNYACELLKQLGINCKVEYLEPIVSNQDGHARLAVWLDDDKYHIKGIYFIDFSASSYKKNFLYRYNFFLKPIDEINDKYKCKWDSQLMDEFDKELRNQIGAKLFFDNMCDKEDEFNKYSNKLNALFANFFDGKIVDKGYVDIIRINDFMDLFNKPIAAEEMIRLLYFVRGELNKEDPILYPFTAEVLLNCLIASEWKFTNNTTKLVCDFVGKNEKNLTVDDYFDFMISLLKIDDNDKFFEHLSKLPTYEEGLFENLYEDENDDYEEDIEETDDYEEDIEEDKGISKTYKNPFSSII